MNAFRPFAATALCGIGSLGGQIIPAGTGVPLTGNEMTIPADLGVKVGGNLFHSFKDFNLATGQSAVFTANPTSGIQNVISRVTGDNATNIDGTIRSDIAGANLFLMNPNGIFFGPNARLDVSGAFVASTADYLGLGGGDDRFYASDLGGSSSLVSHPPEAFGFLASQPAPITVTGSRLGTDAPGRAVALVAGDVTMSAAAALAGEVVVVSAGGAGELGYDARAGSVPLPDPGMEMGHISLANSLITAAAGKGFMGRLLLSGGALWLDGSSITSINLDLPEAPEISLTFSGSVTLTSMSSISSSSEDGAGTGADVFLVAGSLTAGSGGGNLSSTAFTTGKGGDLNMNVRDRIDLAGGSFIETYAFPLATAPAGDVSVTAGSIRIDGELMETLTGIRSQTDALSVGGKGGDVSIRTHGMIEIHRHGSLDAITGPGSVARGGDVFLSAGGLMIDALEFPDDRLPLLTGLSSRTSGDGGAGSVEIEVGSLIMRNGGRIDSSTKSDEGFTATGDGGVISIRAGEILIDGTGALDFAGRRLRTGIVSFTSEGSVPSLGDAGNISVIAEGDITLANGGLIDSSSFGTENAGQVEVRGRNITIDRQSDGIFTGIGSDTSLGMGGGDAGSVTVMAENRIALKQGGLISAATFGDGDAGNVTVMAGEISISGVGETNASVITPESGIVAVSGADSSGAGGDISVTALRQLLITDGGTIGAEARGTGSAGSVDITVGGIRISDGSLGVRSANADAGTLKVASSGGFFSERSEISASAGSDGGNISLSSRGVILLRDSNLTADANGSGGDISFPDARHLVLNRTPVSASAVERDGGNIFVNTGTFFASASPLSVTSERGAPGTVEIRTLDTLGGGQETEDEELLDPDDILQPDCELRNPDAGGSFTKGGRGGTRRLPGGYLPSFRIIE